MSYKQSLGVLLIALFAGVIGGALSVRILQHRRNSSTSADVVRAKQFEAVGAGGNVLARFGVESGTVPSAQLFGPDGKERLSLALDNVDEPIIVMRDINGKVRAYFGHETSDTATPADDDWSVTFRGAKGDLALAQLGTVRSYASRTGRKGVVVLFDESSGKFIPVR